MTHKIKNELFFENLEYLKETAIENNNITDEYEIADIELIFMKLCDYAEYRNFNTNEDRIFNKNELEDFLDFYVSKSNMSPIITPKDAEKIINLLFNLDIDFI